MKMAKRKGESKELSRDIEKIYGNYMRRKALVQRLMKAGIWNDK